MEYLSEFIIIVLVYLVVVVSLGFDFVIIVWYSVNYGWCIVMYVSVGVGLGILLYVVYFLVGLSVVIKIIFWLYNMICYLLVVYLLYFVVGVFWSKLGNLFVNISIDLKVMFVIFKKVLINGFLINGLNFKVMLFFLLLFIVFINVDMFIVVKVFYGIYLVVVIGLWFCMLFYLLSMFGVVKLIGDKGYWLDRFMGVVLVGLVVWFVML